MGFLKKITRPISRVLDKIVPNEIKPALPFLAAAAPFMAPGIMGAFGNTMLSRALISGGLNLGSQLAQEGSEGEFSPLSVALASGVGALTAPGSPGKAIGVDKPVAGFDSPVYASGTGTPSAAQFLEGKAAGMEPGFIKSGLEGLATGSEKLIGLSEGLAADGILSKAGAKALTIPAIQGTTDLAVAEGRRLEKQAAIDDALAQAELLEDSGARAAAIRQFMEAAGYFSDEEIEETITAAGYADGGRVGLKKGGGPDFGGIPAAMQNIKEDEEEIITIMTDDGPIQIEKSVYESMPAMFMDTTTSAYGDAGKGRPVPEFAEGGLMNLGGKEMDLRKGGFVPIGKKERADDVPARLSKNEFVMTADAVRGAGGGDINKGAKRMYETMNRLEARA